MTRLKLGRRQVLAGAAALAAPALAPVIARAQELSEIRIAKQFGISYLPLAVMEDKQLIEKHAREAGLGSVRVSWPQFSAGAPINDALIGGNIEFAGGGVGPMVTLWARPRANLPGRAG